MGKPVEHANEPFRSMKAVRVHRFGGLDAILHEAEGARELAKPNRRKMLQSLRMKALGAATDIPTSPFMG